MLIWIINRKGMNKTNSVAFSPQANYTDWTTAICWRNLVQTFADRGVSHGEHGGSPTVVNLSFLDQTKKGMRKENVFSKEIVRLVRSHVEIRRFSVQSAGMYIDKERTLETFILKVESP
jgi:hypothetical protein